MGLDTVEIIMNIEARFKIHSPDEAASRCDTVAELQNEVVALLRQQRRESGERLQREVYDGIVAEIVNVTGAPSSKIKPELRWVGDITEDG